LDSINQKKDKLLAEVNGKQQALLGNTKKKLDDWQGKIKNKLGINGKGLNLPSNQLPNASLPDLNIPSLSAPDFQNIGLSPELADINQSLPFSKPEGLSQLQGKFGDFKGSVPSLESIKSNPDKIIENAATNIDGVSELKEKLGKGTFEQTEFGALAKNMESPDAMKEMAVEKVKQEAINHFAGKEQALQAAMEKMSKYKLQYSNISSLSEIKKRPPNPMKGKPFIERLVPGIAIQIHVKNYLNFDFNPYAAYRLSGRFSVGLGWNQRLAMDWSTKNVIGEGKVYGPRAFGEFKLPKGFAVRLEMEALNTYVPSHISSTTGEPNRQWVYSTMTGIKKEYRFFKNIKGFTIIQFDFVRLIKPTNNSPYADVVNMRFGFEFPFKKKKPVEVKKGE